MIDVLKIYDIKKYTIYRRVAYKKGATIFYIMSFFYKFAYKKVIKVLTYFC